MLKFVQKPCYDCGSNIEGHHTIRCDLANPTFDRKDLPTIDPNSQHWNMNIPYHLTDSFDRAIAYLNSNEHTGFNSKVNATYDDALQLLETGWKPSHIVKSPIGVCPRCKSLMEVGDEFLDERCCMVCAHRGNCTVKMSPTPKKTERVVNLVNQVRYAFNEADYDHTDWDGHHGDITSWKDGKEVIVIDEEPETLLLDDNLVTALKAKGLEARLESIQTIIITKRKS